MTAREQLRNEIDELTEDEAHAALAAVADRRFIARHGAAPIDDEADDDPATLAEARAEADRGETIPLSQLRRELLES